MKARWEWQMKPKRKIIDKSFMKVPFSLFQILRGRLTNLEVLQKCD